MLTGDFNITSFDELDLLEGVKLTNNENDPITTFKTGGCIDNIIVSSNIDIERVYLSESEFSDHNMLVADIII